jgi:hypothetical protein
MNGRDLRRILAGIAVSTLLAGPALLLSGAPAEGKSG